MLVFPIVNNRHVMNVELRLKGVEKIRQGVTIADTKESEIIVNSEKYSNSSYFSSKDATSEVDFIRSKSILYPRDYFITTKSKNEMIIEYFLIFISNNNQLQSANLYFYLKIQDFKNSQIILLKKIKIYN